VATIVKPITISFTPKRVSSVRDPFTKILEPKLKRNIPNINFSKIFSFPSYFSLNSSMSGSASFVSSSFSLMVLISHIVFKTKQNIKKTPACNVYRPVDDFAQTAQEIAIKSGTSLLTILLFTLRGVINELIPKTTRILKILLPITLLAARESLP